MSPVPRRLVLGILVTGLIAGCRPQPGGPPSAAAPPVGAATTREAALTEFQRAGVFVKAEGEGSDRKVTEVDFRTAPVGDDGLRSLRLFPELTFVGLLGCPVTDAGMEHRAPWPSCKPWSSAGPGSRTAGWPSSPSYRNSAGWSSRALA